MRTKTSLCSADFAAFDRRCGLSFYAQSGTFTRLPDPISPSLLSLSPVASVIRRFPLSH
jgi:hypothetical protein